MVGRSAEARGARSRAREAFQFARLLLDAGRSDEARNAMRWSADRFLVEGLRVHSRVAWRWILRLAPEDPEARNAVACLEATDALVPETPERFLDTASQEYREAPVAPLETSGDELTVAHPETDPSQPTTLQEDP